MTDDAIFVGGCGPGYVDPCEMLLRYGNRHGLIAGATGTGKTVTLQILVEALSDAGVPVVVQDVKGDVSGLSRPGDAGHKAHEALQSRARTIGLEDPEYRAFPVVFWDLFGVVGHPVRTTVTEIGPLLLSRMLELTEAQEGVMNIAFRIADDEGLALLDLADLRAMLTWLGENASEVSRSYGNVAASSIGAIQRRLLVLETQGAGQFLGEPALALDDLMAVDGGRGRVNVLMSDRLMQAPRLYAMVLLWLLSELFEDLPEVGDPDKPRLVFFFDEAHLLFKDAPDALVERVIQVVRLIRSKGVGVYFITQNPDDVPSDVLAQLGNRIQHALRAYTPRDQKALRAAAETFRPNPDFDTETAIREVGTGEAVVSLLEAKGVPGVVRRTLIRPPASRLGPITEAERAATITASPLAGRYDDPVDRHSAQEMLAERAQRIARDAQARESKARDAEVEDRAPGRDRRYAPTRSRRERKPEPSISETLARTVVKELGTRQGRAMVRGILGSLFKAK